MKKRSPNWINAIWRRKLLSASIEIAEGRKKHLARPELSQPIFDFTDMGKLCPASSPSSPGVGSRNVLRIEDDERL